MGVCNYANNYLYYFTQTISKCNKLPMAGYKIFDESL